MTFTSDPLVPVASHYCYRLRSLRRLKFLAGFQKKLSCMRSCAVGGEKGGVERLGSTGLCLAKKNDRLLPVYIPKMHSVQGSASILQFPDRVCQLHFMCSHLCNIILPPRGTP